MIDELSRQFEIWPSSISAVIIGLNIGKSHSLNEKDIV
jgi:hypothetical protein